MAKAKKPAFVGKVAKEQAAGAAAAVEEAPAVESAPEIVGQVNVSTTPEPPTETPVPTPPPTVRVSVSNRAYIPVTAHIPVDLYDSVTIEADILGATPQELLETIIASHIDAASPGILLTKAHLNRLTHLLGREIPSAERLEVEIVRQLTFSLDGVDVELPPEVIERLGYRCEAAGLEWDAFIAQLVTMKLEEEVGFR